MFKKIRARSYLVGALAALTAAPAWADVTTLDVMVLYDQSTATRYNNQPETLIHSWVDQANQMYENSGIDVQLRLVHTALHEPSGRTMSTVLRNVTNDRGVRALRDQYGADFVAQIHRTGNCGVAWLTTGRNGIVSSQASEWAYSVSGPSCGAIVFAHELGHNMGLSHSREQGELGGVFDYGLGHGVHGSFATVMAYPQTFRAPHIQMFSNPDLSCYGLPCGVPIGRSGAAHAVSAVNAVRTQLADFRPTQIPVDDDNDDGNGNGDDPSLPSCPSGATTYSGTLTQEGEMVQHPTDDYFFGRFRQGQEISVHTSGDARFDAILLRYRGFSWSTVATTDSNASEPLSYVGSTGFYSIGVRATSGTGDYTLCHTMQ